MIRREIQLVDQPVQWLLISQVEHARISGLLAAHCLPRDFTAPLSAELLEAVIHHDDGWAAWEAKPPLDAEHHRPPSFRELPLELSLPIWTASIEAAAASGPLAARIVSEHFLALLKASDKPPAPSASAWQQSIAAKSVEWLASWQAINPKSHTPALAEQALRWLQLLDVMSLWLCSVCPGAGEQVPEPPVGYHVSGSLETEFYYEPGYVHMRPWRFNVSELTLSAAGWLLPVRQYRTPEEMLASRTEHKVCWQIADSIS